MRSALDAHAKPPPNIRAVYKKFQTIDQAALAAVDGLTDLSHHRPLRQHADTSCEPESLVRNCSDAFSSFLDGAGLEAPHPASPVIKINSVPGLFVYPSLFPPAVQLALLDRLFHHELSRRQHKSNVDTHYLVPRPRDLHSETSPSSSSSTSYFDLDPLTTTFQPRDPNVHKPITLQQHLGRKLRWMTLGGQYDWTAKQYPGGAPPAFPPALKALIQALFPMRAEAAIVNLYSPGDTLSLHRDVSEECDRPLVSLSLGCDGVFVAGLDDPAAEGGGGSRVVALRLRSGDAVLMSGESRFAWHGVPKVVAGTCPDWMREWPAGTPSDGAHEGHADRYSHWRGWMDGKRVNLNVRQMYA